MTCMWQGSYEQQLQREDDRLKAAQLRLRQLEAEDVERKVAALEARASL